MNFKTLDFLEGLRKELQDFFVSLKNTTKIYYKAEAYSCSVLDLPAVIFTSSSVGEVVTKCKSFSLALVLEFSIITKCSASSSREGLECALEIVSFLTKKDLLANFGIDDSKILESETIDETKQDPRMFTSLTCHLKIRLNEFLSQGEKNE